MSKRQKANIDDWLEETIEKAINEGRLYDVLFTDCGRPLTQSYPKLKLQEMVKRCLKRGK